MIRIIQISHCTAIDLFRHMMRQYMLESLVSPRYLVVHPNVARPKQVNNHDYTAI